MEKKKKKRERKRRGNPFLAGNDAVLRFSLKYLAASARQSESEGGGREQFLKRKCQMALDLNLLLIVSFFFLLFNCFCPRFLSFSFHVLLTT